MAEKSLVPAGRAKRVSWNEPKRTLPDGPVTLWVAIISTEGRVLGAAPLPDAGRLTWCFKNGKFTGRSGPVYIGVWETGEISTAMILAVAGGNYVVVAPFDYLNMSSSKMRKGDTITLDSAEFSFPLGGE